MLDSKFFCKSGGNDPSGAVESPLTFVAVADPEYGSVKYVCLELMDNPLAALDFTDFSISECLKHGISYKSLNISRDMRLGFDSEFEALERRFDELQDKIFVESANS